MTPHHTRAHSGFTLLEAIVALVIMATTLMVLYGWLASSTLGAVRSEETAASLSSARTALSYLERVNPMTQPNGTTEFGTFKLTWHAEPVTDRRTGRTPVGDPSPYDYQLFDLTAQIQGEGFAMREFTVRRAGWVATRVIDPNEL